MISLETGVTNYAVRRSYKAATTELFDSWQLFYSSLIVDFPPALHNALNPLDQQRPEQTSNKHIIKQSVWSRMTGP